MDDKRAEAFVRHWFCEQPRPNRGQDRNEVAARVIIEQWPQVESGEKSYQWLASRILSEADAEMQASLMLAAFALAERALARKEALEEAAKIVEHGVLDGAIIDMRPVAMLAATRSLIEQPGGGTADNPKS